MVPLGTEYSEFNPCIVGIVNTSTTLSEGYTPYVLGICEKYPALVSSIVYADKDTEYDPITLSGVVATDEQAQFSNEDQKKLSITLPEIETFHMPCRTVKEDQPTIFSVAIGNDVAVNLLIGMSFIRVSGMVINCNDGVAEFSTLNCAPSSLVYKSPQRGLPHSIPKENADSNALHADSSVMMKIKETREFFSTVGKPKTEVTFQVTDGSDGSTNVFTKKSGGCK